MWQLRKSQKLKWKNSGWGGGGFFQGNLVIGGKFAGTVFQGEFLLEQLQIIFCSGKAANCGKVSQIELWKAAIYFVLKFGFIFIKLSYNSSLQMKVTERLLLYYFIFHLFWKINHFIFKLVMFTMIIESRNFDIALSHWNIKELLHPDALAKS